MGKVKDRLRAFFSDSTAPGRMWAILAAVGVGVLFVVALAFVYRWACPWPRSAGTVCEAIVKNPPWALLTSIAAAPALMLTWWWRTVHKDTDINHKQLEIDIAKREERSKRFAEAIQLLSSASLESQLGAVYSLDSLAQESKADADRIADTLCAFIRVHGEKKQKAGNGDESSESGESSATQIDVKHVGQPPAVQAAFSVVAQLNVGGPRLDLRNAQLSGIELIGGFVSDVDLSNADLSNTDLIGAKLWGAYLCKADLRDANLGGANLGGADLWNANLSRAYLCKADLRDANLLGACLCDANLSGANLLGACLCGPYLNDAKLETAVFSKAQFGVKTVFPPGFDPIAAGAICVDDDGNPISEPHWLTALETPGSYDERHS